jgi:hypothetical protein
VTVTRQYTLDGLVFETWSDRALWTERARLRDVEKRTRRNSPDLPSIVTRQEQIARELDRRRATRRVAT